MPSREFEYLLEAIDEAWEAYHWYRRRSEVAADEFWQALLRARYFVTEHPFSSGNYLHGTRCRRLQRFPYGLIYLARGEKIVGVAVAHLKRRPGYWRNRLIH